MRKMPCVRCDGVLVKRALDSCRRWPACLRIYSPITLSRFGVFEPRVKFCPSKRLGFFIRKKHDSQSKIPKYSKSSKCKSALKKGRPRRKKSRREPRAAARAVREIRHSEGEYMEQVSCAFSFLSFFLALHTSLKEIFSARKIKIGQIPQEPRESHARGACQ